MSARPSRFGFTLPQRGVFFGDYFAREGKRGGAWMSSFVTQSRLLGTRPGEMNADGLAFEAAGLCLQASNPLPGQPKLHLSYSPNDSRLEQRAAMHLQLSRQYPDAKWLTQFKMLDMPAHLPSDVGPSHVMNLVVAEGDAYWRRRTGSGDARTALVRRHLPLWMADSIQKLRPAGRVNVQNSSTFLAIVLEPCTRLSFTWSTV